MKKLLFTLALSGSGTIFAEPGDMVFDMCIRDYCESAFDGSLKDLAISDTARPGKDIPTITRPPRLQEGSFINFLVGATGHTLGYVRDAFQTIKESVVNAGYDRFTGSLEGPAGKVDFEYNFKTNHWKVSGK